MDEYTLIEKIEKQVDRLFSLLEKCVENEYQLIGKLDSEQLLRFHEMTLKSQEVTFGMLNGTFQVIAKEMGPVVAAGIGKAISDNQVRLAELTK